MASQVDICGKSIPGRGNSTYRCPEAGTRVVCSRKSKEAHERESMKEYRKEVKEA